jgi:hypothetical protein
MALTDTASLVGVYIFQLRLADFFEFRVQRLSLLSGVSESRSPCFTPAFSLRRSCRSLRLTAALALGLIRKTPDAGIVEFGPPTRSGGILSTWLARASSR